MSHEFLWRKQILPLGVISFKGVEVDFTPAYLGNLAAAFAEDALDLVPFIREGPGGRLDNDPERCCGIVRGLEAAADGMDALVAVGREGDAMLEADPGLPVAPRLCEKWRRSDGREFPVVLMALFTARASVLTGLRPWRRESS